MLNYIVSKHEEVVLKPYLLRELATMSGYCSSVLAPMNLSYQVPIGLQQGTYKMCWPEAIGTPIVP